MGLSVIYDYLKQLFQLVGIHATHSYTLYGVVGMLFCMAVTDFSLMYLLVSNGFSVLKASWVSFPTAACIAAGMILFTSHVSGREKKLFLKSAAAVYGGGLLLFLRSAMIIHYPELVSSILGMIALAVVSCLLAYFASICFVFSIGRKRVSGEVVIRFYLIAAILYLFILRLVYLGLAAPCLEESFVVDKFHSGVLATSVTREMLGQTISRWIGSFTELGIYELRLTAEATWWVGLICMFNLARDVHDRATGFKTILLFAVLPFTFGTTFYLTKDAILLLLWTASLYVLYRFLVVGARTAWVAAAIIPVITAAYDPLGGILIIGSFLYIGIKCGSPVWRKDNKLKNWCYTVLATFTIFFVLPGKPVQHSSFVGAAWIDEILGLPLTANPLLLLILVTPVPIMATIACYMQSRKTGVELPYPFRDFLDKDKKLFFGMHFLLPLATGLLASIATGNYIYSSSVVWLGALPCIALTYTKDDGEDGVMVASLLYRGWWVTVLLLIPVYGGVLLRQSL